MNTYLKSLSIASNVGLVVFFISSLLLIILCFIKWSSYFSISISCLYANNNSPEEAIIDLNLITLFIIYIH